MKLAATALITFVAPVAAFAFATAPALAQESRERGAELVREQDGPYVVAMLALPATARVGRINFTVTVESVTRSALVEDAQVEVVATNPEGDPDWLSPAISFTQNPTSYVGNGEFDTPGTWGIEIRVEGPEGLALLSFPLEVNALARSNTIGGAIALAVALAVAVAGAAWIAYSIRRAQRRRQAPPPQ